MALDHRRRELLRRLACLVADGSEVGGGVGLPEHLLGGCQPLVCRREASLKRAVEVATNLLLDCRVRIGVALAQSLVRSEAVSGDGEGDVLVAPRVRAVAD